MQRRLRNTLALAAAGGAVLLGAGTAAADPVDTDSLAPQADSTLSSEDTDSIDAAAEDADVPTSATGDLPTADPLGDLSAPLGESDKAADVNGLGGLGSGLGL